jgi:hypothetical protein
MFPKGKYLSCSCVKSDFDKFFRDSTEATWHPERCPREGFYEERAAEENTARAREILRCEVTVTAVFEEGRLLALSCEKGDFLFAALHYFDKDRTRVELCGLFKEVK